MTTLTASTALTPEQQIESEYPLTALDRCDACGAQAYVRVVVVKSQQELMFCGHHFQPLDNDVRFLKIRDERANLLIKPELTPIPD